MQTVGRLPAQQIAKGKIMSVDIYLDKYCEWFDKNEDTILSSIVQDVAQMAFNQGVKVAHDNFSENSEKTRALELAILNIKDALLKEIKWCRGNRGVNSEEYERAFISGLEQAQRLINAAQKTLLMDERYGEGFLSKV